MLTFNNSNQNLNKASNLLSLFLRALFPSARALPGRQNFFCRNYFYFLWRDSYLTDIISNFNSKSNYEKIAICILQKAIKIYSLCQSMYFERMPVKEKHTNRNENCINRTSHVICQALTITKR